VPPASSVQTTLHHLTQRLLRWGALLGLPVLVHFSHARVPGVPTPNAMLEVGGYQGASSLTGVEPDGVGGSGSDGAPLMIGGEAAPVLCDSQEPMDVLFVGNSYTHFFEMPQMLAAMAESAGCPMNVQYTAPGGARLDEHAVSGVTLSAIGSKEWDVVVLQSYSQSPSQPLDVVKKNTLPDVMTLASAIFDNNPDTALFYYVTWGRRAGDKKFCPQNPQVCSFLGHTEAVYRGYSLYREHTGGSLADVGGAWANVYRDGTKPFGFKELYNPDGTHPSLKGSYLAAAVFFAALFKASPEGLAYPQGLSRASAEYIQKVAGRLPISGA